MNGWTPKDAWREAGLYDPLDPGAAERLALLEYLTERGATIEQMVEAHRMGTLPGVAGDLVTQGRTDMVTVAEIAERSGLPSRASCAPCWPPASRPSADTEVPADLASFMAAFEQGAALMGEEAILAFTRVLGRRRQQRRRGGHRALLRGARDRGPSARVPTSSPGPGWPRPRRPPSPRCPTSWRSW